MVTPADDTGDAKSINFLNCLRAIDHKLLGESSALCDAHDLSGKDVALEAWKTKPTT